MQEKRKKSKKLLPAGWFYWPFFSSTKEYLF